MTDYDCWHAREAHITADSAIANLMRNVGQAPQLATAAIKIFGAEMPRSIARTALVSNLQTMAPEVLQRLEPIRK